MDEGFVSGAPRTWLRIDGAVLFFASIVVFSLIPQHHWWIFPVLFFAPDLFMIGYLRDTKVGALLYNLGHSYFLPSLLVLYGWHHHLALAIGLIWLGHVGFDRMAGYGLKYDSSFKHTHLGDLTRNKHSTRSEP